MSSENIYRAVAFSCNEENPNRRFAELAEKMGLPARSNFGPSPAIVVDNPMEQVLGGFTPEQKALFAS